MLGNTRVGYNEISFYEADNKQTLSTLVTMPNLTYDTIELRLYLNHDVLTSAGSQMTFEELYLAKENKFSGYEPYKTKAEETHENSYKYNNDKISTITHNGTTYSFIYDTFGNIYQVKVGERVLITNNYGARNGDLTNIQYGNGQKIDYTYDRFGRIQTQTKNQGKYTYTYDAKGNLGKMQAPEHEEEYTYDLADRILEVLDQRQRIYKELHIWCKQ